MTGNKYHLPYRNNNSDLSWQDPDFNSGKGERFFRAFDRSAKRGDFKNDK